MHLKANIKIQNPQTDWAVLKTVLFYSVLILVLPIGSFFATKSLLFEWFLGQVGNCVQMCWLLFTYPSPLFPHPHPPRWATWFACWKLFSLFADGDNRDKHCVSCRCCHRPSPCAGSLHLQGIQWTNLETLFGANFEEFCCRHTLMMAKRASSLIEEDISSVKYGLVKPLYLPWFMRILKSRKLNWFDGLLSFCLWCFVISLWG